MTDLEKGFFYWIIALILFSSFLITKFSENQPLMLFYFLSLFFVTWVIIAAIKNYSLKVVHVVIWFILVVQGILLSYIYYFRSIYFTTLYDARYFIFAIIFFILFVTLPVISIKTNYLQKNNQIVDR